MSHLDTFMMFVGYFAAGAATGTVLCYLGKWLFFLSED